LVIDDYHACLHFTTCTCPPTDATVAFDTPVSSHESLPHLPLVCNPIVRLADDGSFTLYSSPLTSMFVRIRRAFTRSSHTFCPSHYANFTTRAPDILLTCIYLVTSRYCAKAYSTGYSTRTRFPKVGSLYPRLAPEHDIFSFGRHYTCDAGGSHLKGDIDKGFTCARHG